MLSTARPHLFLRKILAITNSSRSSNISTSATRFANHYAVLGISKNSTQGEIKAAYYRLSMLYHPDKNQGSETAALKFREITQAYEVLGNFRLRRLYDKGIIHTAGSEYAEKAQEAASQEEVEEDPSTKFYKSRFKKSTVADSEGRSPIYDFDEWSRQHYGTSFQRRQTAKQKYDRSYLKFYSESSYDTPKEKAIRLAEEKLKNESEKDITR
ncbi:dnaJ homolog subfamily C member 30, mitochondrial isoform X2 [Stomoxys calcitrans]|uniref:J domain-containing protein n=1 Tax=Stomoxys calcitrans TaxID=35570 RepID=A0A1I8PFY3_STOCA|nr:dnaJ homolog subfamily C member 30, mitochondrial isoform X2 [Stomoxys calcitrans]